MELKQRSRGLEKLRPNVKVARRIKPDPCRQKFNISSCYYLKKRYESNDFPTVRAATRLPVFYQSIISLLLLIKQSDNKLSLKHANYVISIARWQMLVAPLHLYHCKLYSIYTTIYGA